jgi:hypothetical protein
MNEDINERAALVDAAGKVKFGESVWPKLVAALGNTGVTPDQLVGVISQPNGVDLIAAAGRHALIDAADSDHEAAQAYAEIRDAERLKYRRSRGRA